MEQGHDSRLQQQHPFPHNQASFPPPAQNRPLFSVSSHPQSTPQTYINQIRRPPDPYYDQQRSYGPDSHPLNHARHQIGAPITHEVASHLSIPSLPSPQNHVQSGPHQNYASPLPRVPTGPVGVAAIFPGNPNHTSLPHTSVSRTGGIAIADILGGPSAHESATQYNSPAKTVGPIFNSTSSSPRVNKARTDYPPYQRSKTPDYSRKIDMHENRVNMAESPSGPDHYKTLESQRYDAPQKMNQSYLQREISHEERKDTARKINIVGPARPNSQPINYNVPQPPNSERTQMHMPTVLNMRTDPTKQPKDSSSFGRPVSEEIERQKSYTFSERDRIREQQERETVMKRDKERDKKDQRLPADQDSSNQREYPMQVPQRKVWYSRPPEPQDWIQNGSYELPRPAYEPITDCEGQPPRHSVNNYEYPAPSALQFAGQSVYSPNEHRNGPASSLTPQNNSMSEASRQERHACPQQLKTFTVTPQNGPYLPHESHGKKAMEETQSSQQRNFLGIQEINRKSQVSPLPQMAQSGQIQADGPGGEPSIKNEFGRMFSGIGSGVGSALQAPSPTIVQSFPVISGMRREEMETLLELQSIYEPQSAAIQGSKRRKIQEDKGDDENAIGINSPNRRVKRTRTYFHQKQRINEPVESNLSSQQNTLPVSTPNSTLNSSQQADDKQNTNSHHHPGATQHNHHQLSGSKGQAPVSIPPNHNIIPLPKLSILNDAVLKYVVNLPRNHLGYGYYGSTLKASSYPFSFNRDSGPTCGFTSTPDALPLFVGRENCTYTVKIPRIYLEDFVREEVTSRKAIWGTDIYTDDSDVLAACIHSGWFRGAWPEDVDVSLLGLELKQDENGDSIPPDEIKENQLLESPSEKGPCHIPPRCDCHVTILILPLLDSYASSTRFGIKSREWGIERKGWKGKHDGLSYMIKSVRFVSGVDGEEGRSGRSRCNILKKQLQEREANQENMQWMNRRRTENDGSCQVDLEKDIIRKECFVGVKGLGMGGWWKKYTSVMTNTKEKKGFKAQLPEKFGAQSHNPVDTGSRLSSSLFDEHPTEKPSSPLLPTHETQNILLRKMIISQITETMKRNSNYAVTVSTDLAD